MLLLVTMVFRASQNMAQTTLSIVGRERLGLSPGVIGALVAVAAVCGVAVTAWVAPLVEERHRPGALLASLTLVAAALVIFAFATSWPELGGAALLLALGGGLGMPTLMTAAGTGSEEEREKDLAMLTVALSLSLAAGPLLEAGVLRATGQSLTDAFLAFLALPVAGISLLALKPASFAPAGHRHEDLGRSPEIQEPPLATVIPNDPNPIHLRDGGPGGYRQLAKNPYWRLALTANLLYQVPFVAIVTFGGAMGHTLFHASDAEAVLAFSAFFVTSFGARSWVVWRSPLRRKLATLWLAAGLTVLGIVVMAIGHGVLILVVAMAVLGVPHGLIFPIALGMIARSAPRAQLARANAGMLALSSGFTIAVPAALGGLAELYGYRGMMMLVLVPVLAFGVLLAAWSRGVEAW